MNNSVQSLARGMEVLRLLAVHGRCTASEIARNLKIHQSSVSRQLRSLQDAGFVYKPDFHHFAPDHGLLLLAGLAMEGFSEVGAAVTVCTRIRRDTGFGTAAAVLRNGRLIYLARLSPETDASLVMVSDSGYPVYRSSLGLAVSYSQSRDNLIEVLRASQGGENASEDTLGKLSRETRNSFKRHGFLYLPNFEQKKFNAASLFTTVRGTAALAVFSETRHASPGQVKPVLEQGIVELEHIIAMKEGRKRNESI